MTVTLDITDLIAMLIVQLVVGACGAMVALQLLSYRVRALEDGMRSVWNAVRAERTRIDQLFSRR